MVSSSQRQYRILVVDDNEAIHDDFKKILNAEKKDAGLEDFESQLFGEEGDGSSSADKLNIDFEIDDAFQGEAAFKKVQESIDEGRPYALAFVDMRMPPGWDGLKTIECLWRADPDLQIVICSAYSDYTWSEIASRLGNNGQLLILKKPFEKIEVLQAAYSLTQKWDLLRQTEQHVSLLDSKVRERTAALEEANRQLLHEKTTLERVEMELRLSQKLEAVGQLAAGVAHEINTPIQYVGDNLDFLKNCFSDVCDLIKQYQKAENVLLEISEQKELAESLQKAREDVDFDYLLEEVPRAFEQTRDGANQVAKIVRAMKDFSHPGQDEKIHADLNEAILNTLTVSKNEYKFVADIETELGDIPLISCLISDINQVFLNLIVNAAHAIEDANKDKENGDKGLIRIATSADEETISVRIEDSGCGIPEEIKNKIFDPFFTTKEVGKGTGQGLAIARSIVHEKHNGILNLESEVGKGTVFTILLPLNANNDVAEVMMDFHSIRNDVEKVQNSIN